MRVRVRAPDRRGARTEPNTAAANAYKPKPDGAGVELEVGRTGYPNLPSGLQVIIRPMPSSLGPPRTGLFNPEGTTSGKTLLLAVIVFFFVFFFKALNATDSRAKHGAKLSLLLPVKVHIAPK